MVLHNPADITLSALLVLLVLRKHAPLITIGDVSIACGRQKGGGSGRSSESHR